MVPSPTSQMRKLTPVNRLSINANICSVLITIMACLSVGSSVCSRETIWRIFCSTSEILTPLRPVTHSRSTTAPRWYTFWATGSGTDTVSSALPLMLMLPELTSTPTTW